MIQNNTFRADGAMEERRGEGGREGGRGGERERQKAR